MLCSIVNDMKYIKSFLVLVIVFAAHVCSAEVLDAEGEKDLKANAKKLFEATQGGDVDALIKYTHPAIYEIAGGKEKFIEITKMAMDMLEKQKIEFGDIEYGKPSELYEVEGGKLCVLPTKSVIKVGDKRVRSEGYMLAIKETATGDWLFLDGNGFKGNHDMLFKMFPKLPKSIELPETIAEPIVE